MKYNNETQRLINNKSSNEDTKAERYQDEPEMNYPSDKEEEDQEDEDCIDDDGSLASKLLNRETCV